MRIRTRLFITFAALVIALGIISAGIGVSLIQDRVVKEAQSRVRSDLGSAWSVTNAELQQIETILKLAAEAPIIVDACFASNWPNQDVQNRLETIRMDFSLDFLSIVSAQGQVVARGIPPYATGDFRLSNPVIFKALKGQMVTSLEIMAAEELEHEQKGLAERAFLVLEETSHARPRRKTEETRGMVLMGAAPIIRGNQLVGVIYGGSLLNRNYGMVDRITEMVFKPIEPNGRATGTVTIFLQESRIATTVRLANGNRAIGTRASKEVADRVLDNGLRWEGRAFVVNDWYLTAYDPIRDVQGTVVGMLYVGFPERPYNELIRDAILRYLLLSIAGIGVALLLDFFLAERLSRPLKSLVAAAQKIYRGERPAPVSAKAAADEIADLMQTFNQMAAMITERETSLKSANAELARTNASLTSLNHGYMEMLGFIAHELKSPLATIMNYMFLIREEKLGALTEKQQRAVATIDNNLKLISEMARHYLDLSRIESGEFAPLTARVELLPDVLAPLFESHSAAAAERRMTFSNAVAADVALRADPNMTREVFENLLSNAIKYGREGGTIKIAAQAAGDVVRCSVANEGPGVAPEHIPALFRKFARLEQAQATPKQKGTGLGLFICKHIIEAHGGEIQVETRPGEGIEFIFTLPRYIDDSQFAINN